MLVRLQVAFAKDSAAKKHGIRIMAVISARNEVEHLANTIISLKRQTMPIEKIIVINDGSEDGTGILARNHGCTVVDLPFHKDSYIGRPELAECFNAGLKIAREENADYVLIVGADHPLPSDYVEKLVVRMERNSKLMVASGCIKGEPITESAPRGSGRLIRGSFWRDLNGMQYPVVWGWESWLCLKAQQMGYETICYRDIVTEVSRPTGLKKSNNLGKAMYALGYHWAYVLGRSFLTFLKSPKAGMSMFWGWFRHNDIERLDIAEWVNQMQKRKIFERFLQIIRHGGRT